MYSKVLADESIQVSMEVEDFDGEIRKYQAAGETLLGAMGNCFCELIDENIGDVKNERILIDTNKGAYGRTLININLVAEHEGEDKEIYHSGEGILETVVKAIYKLKEDNGSQDSDFKDIK